MSNTLSNPQLARSALQAFRHLPGVVGLGLGFKETRCGTRNPEIALRVIVREKRPLSELSPRERVPGVFEGAITDVCTVVQTEPVDSSLFGGAEIDVQQNLGGGTLGCLAKVNAGGAIVLLTAAHVLYDTPGNQLGPGGAVGSPRLSCCWFCTTGAVADVTAGVMNELLDCAIATPRGNRAFAQRIPGLGPTVNGDYEDLITGEAPLVESGGFLAPVRVGDIVRKVGARTHFTRGDVSSINFPFSIPADPEIGAPEMLPGQMIITPRENDGGYIHKKDGKSYFTLKGDSGAVIVNQQNQVAGLVHRAAILNNPPSWAGWGAVVTDIHKVKAALHISIPSSDDESVGTTPTFALMPGSGIYGHQKVRGEAREQMAFLEAFKGMLRQFELGRRLVESIEALHGELLQLVNHNRRVTVMWHRAHGPGFVAVLARNLRGMDDAIPQSLQGTTLDELAETMRRTLLAHGSLELTAAIETWSPFIAVLSKSPTLRAFVENLRQAERHG